MEEIKLSGAADENSRRGRAIAEFDPDSVRDGVKEFSDDVPDG